MACGQGIEGCGHFENSPIDQNYANSNCEGDPRGAWRGLALAVDFNGNTDWYR